jgi:hypothetical protein
MDQVTAEIRAHARAANLELDSGTLLFMSAYQSELARRAFRSSHLCGHALDFASYTSALMALLAGDDEQVSRLWELER